MAVSSDLLALPSGANLQFTDVTIDVGVALTVPSGTCFRCTGTFTNNGTIEVRKGAISGGTGGVPGAGVSRRTAGNGEAGPDTSTVFGGSEGIGLALEEAALLLVITPTAGGAGGGLFGEFDDTGGAGGGEVVVLAHGAIVNGATGVIRADGETAALAGAGGGAGGIVILASPTSVTNEGLISAHGGNGASADGPANIAAGGAGGGGIVHLISPSITTILGTVDVVGATGGTGATGAAGTRFSGGGGGACGGDGGPGGDVFTDNTLDAGGNGSDGRSFETLEDPTALFW